LPQVTLESEFPDKYPQTARHGEGVEDCRDQPSLHDKEVPTGRDLAGSSYIFRVSAENDAQSSLDDVKTGFHILVLRR
jgi:hypothetical protein